MAKRIIILEKQNATQWSVCFWVDIPLARRSFYADPNKVSMYKDATAGEITALRDGSVYEVIDTIGIEEGSTLAGLRRLLQEHWQHLQAVATSEGKFGYYGTYWDGVAWTQVGA